MTISRLQDFFIALTIGLWIASIASESIAQPSVSGYNIATEKPGCPTVPILSVRPSAGDAISFARYQSLNEALKSQIRTVVIAECPSTDRVLVRIYPSLRAPKPKSILAKRSDGWNLDVDAARSLDDLTSAPKTRKSANEEYEVRLRREEIISKLPRLLEYCSEAAHAKSCYEACLVNNQPACQAVLNGCFKKSDEPSCYYACQLGRGEACQIYPILRTEREQREYDEVEQYFRQNPQCVGSNWWIEGESARPPSWCEYVR